MSQSYFLSIMVGRGLMQVTSKNHYVPLYSAFVSLAFMQRNVIQHTSAPAGRGCSVLTHKEKFLSVKSHQASRQQEVSPSMTRTAIP